MIDVTVTRIQFDVPADWRPPFGPALPAGFRQVDEHEALRSARPHRVVARGGRHDGYEECWVADVPCGCEGHE